MNMKSTITILAAVVSLAWAANTALAQQVDAKASRQPFKGPVKVFILAGQSNMEGHGGVKTLDQLGAHPTHGHLLTKIKRDDGSFIVRDDVFVSYQQAKQASDQHVCNWYSHYQGSARVYCMVGYSLAEAMKPLLKTKPQ